MPILLRHELAGTSALLSYSACRVVPYGTSRIKKFKTAIMKPSGWPWLFIVNHNDRSVGDLPNTYLPANLFQRIEHKCALL